MSSDSGLVRAVGLMSGTSMDGIDAALIETDGRARLQFGPTRFYSYEAEDRALLRAALERAAETGTIEAGGAIGAAVEMVTRRHAEAVETFFAEAGITRSSIDLIGFHGQTILHRPKDRVTLQIGDGKALAARLEIPVVYDFRSADVRAGGEGAPLAPIFHAALVEAAGLPKPVAILNVGGVANLTYVRDAGDPIAFDTGPGNALLDDMMLERTGAPFDRDGEAAARGRVDAAALRRLLDHPYFALPPPKSLDRNQFSSEPVAALSLEDGAATLVAFTAETVALALAVCGPPPERLVVCGGGARNPALLSALQRRLSCRVEKADEFGWSPDFIEAQAFAYMAVRSRRGLALTFPSTTGAQSPLTGGVLADPDAQPDPPALF